MRPATWATGRGWGAPGLSPIYKGYGDYIGFKACICCYIHGKVLGSYKDFIGMDKENGRNSFMMILVLGFREGISMRGAPSPIPISRTHISRTPQKGRLVFEARHVGMLRL